MTGDEVAIDLMDKLRSICRITRNKHDARVLAKEVLGKDGAGYDLTTPLTCMMEYLDLPEERAP